jgi:nitroreductase
MLTALRRLKKYLGTSYRSASAAWGRLRAHALPLVAWSGFLSALYYFVLSGAFRRENRAVAAGLAASRRELRRQGYSMYFLRQNAHRIEKGLIMKARRAVFAANYILATVRAFARFTAALPEGGAAEADWLWSVLNDYFNATGDHRAIEKPFSASNLDVRPVTFEEFRALALLRKSVRWYLQKPVPRELIDKAIGVAGLAPSACNRQPITFHVFDDPHTIARVSALAGGAEGFSQNFPALVVVTGQLRAYFNEQDRHIIYIDGSLATMSFIHALLSMGVASCIINWPDVAQRDRRMSRLLALKSDERVVLLISLGYPDPGGLVPFSQKKAPESMRVYNA